MCKQSPLLYKPGMGWGWEEMGEGKLKKWRPGVRVLAGQAPGPELEFPAPR